MRIELTTDWSSEKIAPYGRDITKAMHKLVARFPKDMTVEGLAADILSGRNQLWLILDEEDAFKAFVLSEIKIVEATGHKVAMLSELAGEGGVDVVPLIAPIEEWARAEGCKELRPVGRRGWERALKKQGYKADICLYSKEL